MCRQTFWSKLVCREPKKVENHWCKARFEPTILRVRYQLCQSLRYSHKGIKFGLKIDVIVIVMKLQFFGQIWLFLFALVFKHLDFHYKTNILHIKKNTPLYKYEKFNTTLHEIKYLAVTLGSSMNDVPQFWII